MHLSVPEHSPLGVGDFTVISCRDQMQSVFASQSFSGLLLDWRFACGSMPPWRLQHTNTGSFPSFSSPPLSLLNSHIFDRLNHLQNMGRTLSTMASFISLLLFLHLPSPGSAYMHLSEEPSYCQVIGGSDLYGVDVRLGFYLQ